MFGFNLFQRNQENPKDPSTISDRTGAGTSSFRNAQAISKAISRKESRLIVSNHDPGISGSERGRYKPPSSGQPSNNSLFQ
jgi:hypothetical protein